jgi:predicted nucleic acid-binding protein
MKMAREGVLIDTEGLDKFLVPDTPALKRYWDSFGADAVHFISPIAYWEFLNGYDEYSPMRRRLANRIAQQQLQFLAFDREVADRAADIYRALQPIISKIPKSKKRERLEPLQCDVFIAATAHCRQKRVFTMDVGDWLHIQIAIRGISIQPLEIDFGNDLPSSGK